VARRSGLGRGLGALIPPEARAAPAGGLVELPVTSISASSFQPRRHFDEEALATLTASVRELGVLQPILVRPAGDGSFELVAGERRWRAARRAGLPTIPALVREVADSASLEQALVENIHRQDLNPLEEAAAYQQLLEDFQLTHEALAARVGRSRAAVTNTLRLFQLPPSVQRLVADGQLGEGHARALLGTPDRAYQESLARRAVAEGLSVRAVEQAVRARTATPPDQGEAAAETRAAAPVARLRPPGLLELEQLLADHLDTRVKVEMGAKRGRVVIDFATLDDLERLYRVMVEGAPGPPASA